MFKRRMFEVFHGGSSAISARKTPLPWYLVMTKQSDNQGLVEWKMKELELSAQEGFPYQNGRGIPDVGYIPLSYTKSEVTNFICATGLSPVSYDFNSTKLFRPSPKYPESSLYEAYMVRVRRAINLRTTVEDWFS